jgi:NAD(P)-dependent dehydrogenase (short-subunit alcohol dehydrogenase family)
MKLQGKVCIVTGASSGMGWAIAKLFAEEGATVVACARRRQRLDELAAENKNIIPRVVDVIERSQVIDLVRGTIKEQGRVDVLVNNAGILDDFLPLGELTDEMWSRVMRVNVDAPMYSMREALPAMLAQGGGVIVNIASIGGLYGSRAGIAYTTSKHALVGMTKNVAFQYGTHLEDASPFGMQRAMAGVAANIRNGKPEEIAALALFLASDASSLINGATVVADGGLTAY